MHFVGSYYIPILILSPLLCLDITARLQNVTHSYAICTSWYAAFGQIVRRKAVIFWSPRRCGFDLRTVCVGRAVSNVVLGQFLCRYFGFSPVTRRHITLATHTGVDMAERRYLTRSELHCVAEYPISALTPAIISVKLSDFLGSSR